MTVSIILPTYNERENIVPLIKAIDRTVRFDHEIIVVDDNSPDGTSRVVRAYIGQSENRSIRIVTRTRDRGLTRSIRHGIQVARGNIIVWMDCDFSMPPSVIPKLVRAVGAGADIAVGSRFVPGGRAKESHAGSKDSAAAILMSRVLNSLIQKIFGYHFYDYTSGFVASKREVFDKIQLQGDYGEYFIDFIIRALRRGLRVSEIPYTSMPRKAGTSKTAPDVNGLIRHGVLYIGTVFRLYRNNPDTDSDFVYAHKGAVVIRPMENGDVERVARLHIRSLPATSTSRMGLSFVRRLYTWFIRQPMHIAAVAESGGMVIGVITVTLDFRRSQQSAASALWWAMLPGVFSPSKLFRRMQFTIGVDTLFSHPHVSIETLCVDPRIRRRGVGRKLILYAIKAVILRGKHELFVDAQKENIIAQQFYTTLGFSPVKEIVDSVVFLKKI